MESRQMVKTKYRATIFDGHSHIERRVYEDQFGWRNVRINGFFTRIIDLERINRFDVDVWYDG